MNKIKDFFSVKRNLIATVIVIIILIILLIVVFKDNDDYEKKFSLNAIYDVYPEEVRKLYSNIVGANCFGDLKLDIELGVGKVKVEDIKDNNKLDYLFSYIDKNSKLEDEMSKGIFEDAAKLLYSKDINIISMIKDYQHLGYVYNVSGDNIVREEKECSDVQKQYVSHLYGYSYNENLLSVDVNIGYSSDGVLYDMADNKLGEYDGKIEKLSELFGSNSYYRFNYIKDNGKYKLDSVEWNNRV